jgi:hypothetical protein
MSLSLSLPSYLVSGEFSYTAMISPANAEDMPDSWSCAWPVFWTQMFGASEAIIKITHGEQLLGLARFNLYPSRVNTYQVELVEILNIETLPKEDRVFNPVASWLIWYVSQIAMECAQGNETGYILSLVSLESAMDFYRNKVKMEGLGWITIAPNEDGYAFAFSQITARGFCNRIEHQYGNPQRWSVQSRESE